MSSEQALLARRWWREDTLRGTGALDTPLRAPARLIRELDEHELLMDLDFLRVHAEKLVATLAREFRPATQLDVRHAALPRPLDFLAGASRDRLMALRKKPISHTRSLSGSRAAGLTLTRPRVSPRITRALVVGGLVLAAIACLSAERPQ